MFNFRLYKKIILILLNPFNIISLMLAKNGRAIWGVGSDYRLDYNVYTLIKVFAVPTLVFGAILFILDRYKKWNLFILYSLSLILSLVSIWFFSKLYWMIVK